MYQMGPGSLNIPAGSPAYELILAEISMGRIMEETRILMMKPVGI